MPFYDADGTYGGYLNSLVNKPNQWKGDWSSLRKFVSKYENDVDSVINNNKPGLSIRELMAFEKSMPDNDLILCMFYYTMKTRPKGEQSRTTYSYQFCLFSREGGSVLDITPAIDTRSEEWAPAILNDSKHGLSKVSTQILAHAHTLNQAGVHLRSMDSKAIAGWFSEFLQKSGEKTDIMSRLDYSNFAIKSVPLDETNLAMEEAAATYGRSTIRDGRIAYSDILAILRLFGQRIVDGRAIGSYAAELFGRTKAFDEEFFGEVEQEVKAVASSWLTQDSDGVDTINRLIRTEIDPILVNILNEQNATRLVVYENPFLDMQELDKALANRNANLLATRTDVENLINGERTLKNLNIRLARTYLLHLINQLPELSSATPETTFLMESLAVAGSQTINQESDAIREWTRLQFAGKNSGEFKYIVLPIVYEGNRVELVIFLQNVKSKAPKAAYHLRFASFSPQTHKELEDYVTGAIEIIQDEIFKLSVSLGMRFQANVNSVEQSFLYGCLQLRALLYDPFAVLPALPKQNAKRKTAAALPLQTMEILKSLLIESTKAGDFINIEQAAMFSFFSKTLNPEQDEEEPYDEELYTRIQSVVGRQKETIKEQRKEQAKITEEERMAVLLEEREKRAQLKLRFAVTTEYNTVFDDTIYRQTFAEPSPIFGELPHYPLDLLYMYMAHLNEEASLDPQELRGPLSTSSATDILDALSAPLSVVSKATFDKRLFFLSRYNVVDRFYAAERSTRKPLTNEEIQQFARDPFGSVFSSLSKYAIFPMTYEAKEKKGEIEKRLAETLKSDYKPIKGNRENSDANGDFTYQSHVLFVVCNVDRIYSQSYAKIKGSATDPVMANVQHGNYHVLILYPGFNNRNQFLNTLGTNKSRRLSLVEPKESTWYKLTARKCIAFLQSICEFSISETHARTSMNSRLQADEIKKRTITVDVHLVDAVKDKLDEWQGSETAQGTGAPKVTPAEIEELKKTAKLNYTVDNSSLNLIEIFQRVIATDIDGFIQQSETRRASVSTAPVRQESSDIMAVETPGEEGTLEKPRKKKDPLSKALSRDLLRVLTASGFIFQPTKTAEDIKAYFDGLKATADTTNTIEEAREEVQREDDEAKEKRRADIAAKKFAKKTSTTTSTSRSDSTEGVE
jgi:hypothetical protein